MTNTLTVKDLMSKPVTVAKSVPITEALDKMLDEEIDPLIVVHNDEVVGTVSRFCVAEKLGTKRNSDLSPTAIRVANAIDEDFTIIYEDEDLDILIPLLQQYKLVVVYNADNNLIGQVTSGDLLARVRPEGDLSSVVQTASRIDADERVVHLRRRMIDEEISRFVVTNGDEIVGVVSETDVAVSLRKFRESVEDRYQEHQVRNILVRDIMSSPVISVEEDALLPATIDTMLNKKISSIPITRKGKLAGIVTRMSLIQAL
ncbi:MAG: CBS domain-containing protein [Methanospirillaceae archaeon]|nr:CBS domain-containing protein [Methanospirillaceae archaeon]